jgi:hypothetical protein
MTSNSGLIGFPLGKGLLDGSSIGSFGAAVLGADVHWVNLPQSPDGLQSGTLFRYVPLDGNVGPVQVMLNGAGPLDLRKSVRTISSESATALLPLVAGDIIAGATLVCMTRQGGIIEVLSGIATRPTDIGLDLENAASQAAARSTLGLASGATTTVGTAAARNVGTNINNVVEVVDGSGNVNAALNVANRQLANLTTSGLPRVVWASLAFTGAGAVIVSFNGGAVTRVSAGLYNITWPSGPVGSYNVIPVMDAPDTNSGKQCLVVSGSRTSTGVQISCRSGNSSVDPFDPDRVTVSVFPVA